MPTHAIGVANRCVAASRSQQNVVSEVAVHGRMRSKSSRWCHGRGEKETNRLYNPAEILSHGLRLDLSVDTLISKKQGVSLSEHSNLNSSLLILFRYRKFHRKWSAKNTFISRLFQDTTAIDKILESEIQFSHFEANCLRKCLNRCAVPS